MLKYSKISQYRIKKLIKAFCLDLTAVQAAHLLGLNRNTVNRWYGIFRKAIWIHQHAAFKQFVGEVEVDECYFGARRVRGWNGKLKRGRGTLKQPVFGIFLRNGGVYTEIIHDCRKRTLQAIIRGKVDPESVIYSDSWCGYDGLVDVGYGKHLRVNHGKSVFAKNQVHINGIESFWSFTKRRLSKFNGVKINFEIHLKECEWRFNKTAEQLETDLLLLLKYYGNLLV